MCPLTFGPRVVHLTLTFVDYAKFVELVRKGIVIERQFRNVCIVDQNLNFSTQSILF